MATTTLVEDYLNGHDGDAEGYITRLQTQRIGQAFMNSLSKEDYERLTGTLYDPFYSEGQDATYVAMAWLLDNLE